MNDQRLEEKPEPQQMKSKIEEEGEPVKKVKSKLLQALRNEDEEIDKESKDEFAGHKIVLYQNEVSYSIFIFCKNV